MVAQEHKKTLNKRGGGLNEVLFLEDWRCGVLFGASAFYPHFADVNRHCTCCWSSRHSNIPIYPVRQQYK